MGNFDVTSIVIHTDPDEATDEIKGFHVLPRRWVVERTFAWIGRYRRLSKDYESLTQTSETMIYATMVNIMIRRLARNNQAFRS
jgi:putative transposase